MKCPECGGNLRVYRTWHRSDTTTRHYARCQGCARRYITETTLLGPVGERKRPRPTTTPGLDYERVLTTLRQKMTQATFDQWVKPTRLHFYNGNGRVVIAAQNAFAQEWLTRRLGGIFEQTLSNEVGHTVTVEFVVGK